MTAKMKLIFRGAFFTSLSMVVYFFLLRGIKLDKIPSLRLINFLILFGADMKKHLYFRKGNSKYYLNKNDIDMAIILKILIFRYLKKEKNNYDKFNFLKNYFNINEYVGI